MEEEGHIKGWLLVTAGNICKNMLKHWSRKSQKLEESICEVGKEDEYKIEMLELVMNLPQKYKTVVYLYYYEEYNSVQISQIMKMPESTVRTYLQKARKLLKQEL
ncbi:MAG: RNA polymerase sigma factor [Eubacterium sp.]|nr:RNA polymerase sigma factor [Eubacterium sp.]